MKIAPFQTSLVRRDTCTAERRKSQAALFGWVNRGLQPMS